MNAPSSRRVKLQKFRTLYSPHDERGSDLFIYTTKKPVAYKRTSPPSLSPPEPPAYFHRRAPTISFSLFSFHSSTLVPMHLHARAIQPSPIYGILKVNRSMHACSPIFLALKKKKNFLEILLPSPPSRTYVIRFRTNFFPLVIGASPQREEFDYWPRERHCVCHARRVRSFFPRKIFFRESIIRAQ